VASISRSVPIHLGLDVHKDTISVGILPTDQQIPDVERIAHDEASVRRLACRLGHPRMLRACYQAGPTGFELARLLASMGISCQVIAPSLIPKAPGDKARDRPARLPPAHRGCTALASWSPSASPPSRRRRCGTCAAPAPTWSKT
jgi:transposase